VGVNWAFRDLSPSIASPRNLLESYVDCARLIRCLRGFQRYAITQTPRVVAYRLPKFVRALRGFQSLAVTKVHIR
jgi:hypothetical protein